jgi:Flp pilus assembly protein TadD
VLLHIAATAMAYLAARRLLRNDAGALLAALLFAVHPAHVESVAWISGAPDPLMAVFFFASYWGFLRWREDKGTGWLLLSLGCYALAALSKEPGIMLVVLVLGHAFLFPNKDRMAVTGFFSRTLSALKESVPYILLLASYFVIRFAALKQIAEHKMNLSWATVVMTWPWLLWFYVKKLFWAAPISEFYDSPYVNSVTSPEFWIPLLLLAVLATFLWLWWRRTHDRMIPLAVLWIVIPLLPTFDLVAFPAHEYAHDRYLYISVFGFGLLLARMLWSPAVAALWGRWRAQKLRLAVIAAVSLSFAALTVQQSVYWASNLLLYSRGVEIAPKTSISAINNLIPEMMRLGMYQEALEKIQFAAQQHPGDWGLQFNAGNILMQMDHLPQAEMYLRKATEMVKDQRSEPWLYLGLVQMKRGDPAEAEAPLRRAMAIDPESRLNRYALARDLIDQGKLLPARELLQQLVREAPQEQNYREQLTELEKKLKHPNLTLNDGSTTTTPERSKR